VPTDAEIQHQARWTVYDDDDPWNQTAADNAEWLIRFKRDVGLCEPNSGPGLPISVRTWQVSEGGSGFNPPYVAPAENTNIHFNGEVPVRMDAKIYNVKPDTAERFAKGLAGRWKPPGVVFCSRELEDGLNKFMVESLNAGNTPSDDEIRAKAKEILSADETAADDVLLLEKFKAIHGLSTAPGIEDIQTEQMDFTNLNEDDLLAKLDDELAASGLDTWSPTKVSPSTADLFSSSLPRSPLSFTPLSARSGHTALDIAGGEPVPGVKQSETTEQAIGIAREYAEIYRVHAATASPLRRRVSVKEARIRCPEGWDDEVGGSCE
jgi:hypothetical protein